MNKRTLGYLLALGSAATGAARFNLAVFADLRGLAHVPFLAYSLVVGLVLSVVHVLVKDGPRGFVPLQGRWREALLYGVLMAWSTLSHFLALDYLNETVMSSLAQTGILLTIALAVWLLGERFTLMEWIATAIIISGVFLFDPWGGVRLTGFLILMSGVLGGAFSTVVAKRGVAGIPPQVLMVWRNAVTLVVAGVFMLVRYGLPSFTLEAGLACAVAGVFGPYLHGLFFLQALQYIDAAKAALMNRVSPAIVFVLSWLFLDRMPDGKGLISAAVIVAGTVWLALARPQQK